MYSEVYPETLAKVLSHDEFVAILQLEQKWHGNLDLNGTNNRMLDHWQFLKWLRENGRLDS